jgi:hypothetical protein
MDRGLFYWPNHSVETQLSNNNNNNKIGVTGNPTTVIVSVLPEHFSKTVEDLAASIVGCPSCLEEVGVYLHANYAQWLWHG